MNPVVNAISSVVLLGLLYVMWRSDQLERNMRWDSRSWIDNESLGFAREKSFGSVENSNLNSMEMTHKIASEYPSWVTSKFLPFLSLKADSSGRWSLCIPLIGTKLLTFSPLRRARKGNGWWYRVEGGLLADTPASGTLAFDFRATPYEITPYEDDYLDDDVNDNG